ncbi:MAG: tetratricopeptide repeat protein [Bacteroidales bacterium]|nr:tetratricopeptide repeat protein [Bacteroidales bacterium]
MIKYIGGEYKVFQQFGGAMGEVFLVEKQGINFPFVLKSYQDIDPSLENLFLTEVKNWTSFGVHQNIVKTLFAEKIDGKIFVAAEFVEGYEDGENLLTNFIGKDLPLHIIIKWAIQFTYGMNHCLGKGMIAHSDIKPDNLLIDKELNLKITDFGLSKSYLNDDKIGGGTPMYYSPEQIHQPENIDHRSDIYSFGILLYQLITKGNYPYVMSSPDIREVHLTETIKPINHPLFSICRKCLEKDLSKRYQQFQELFKDLETVAKKEGIEIPKQIITRDDKLEELYILSRSLHAIGETAEALKAINQYLSYQSDYYSAWSQKGRLEFELGNLQNALEATKKAVYLYQYSSTALNNLGIIYLELDNSEDAKTCLLRAVEIDPENSGASMNLANALVETGDFNESAQCILRCFELTPTKNSVHQNAKKLLPTFVQNKLFSLSSDIYRKLREFSELTINEYFNAAMCNFEIHQFEEAIINFDLILEKNSKDKEAIVNISKSYFFIGNIDKAIYYAEKLISEELNPVQGMSMKAQYLHQSGKINQAIRYLVDILYKYPKTDYLWITLGDINFKEKLFKKALDCYESAKEILEHKGVLDSDDNLLFIEQKINETKHYI